MGINASKVPYTGGNTTPVEPMEAGNYPTRLVQVIDLGLQPQQPYKGEEKPPAYMIMTTYEFTDEFMKDEDGNDIEDRPRWLSEEFPLYSLESERARSTKRYNVLDPEHVHEGDWGQLLSYICTTTVVQSEGKGKNAGKMYNNIAATSPMRAKDAEKVPLLINPPKIFNLDEPDLDTFNSLPNWLQDKIKGNLEFKGSKLDVLLHGESATGESIPDTDTPVTDESENLPW
jgi:hypothetical protein